MAGISLQPGTIGTQIAGPDTQEAIDDIRNKIYIGTITLHRATQVYSVYGNFEKTLCEIDWIR